MLFQLVGENPPAERERERDSVLSEFKLSYLIPGHSIVHISLYCVNLEK